MVVLLAHAIVVRVWIAVDHHAVVLIARAHAAVRMAIANRGSAAALCVTPTTTLN